MRGLLQSKVQLLKVVARFDDIMRCDNVRLLGSSTLLSTISLETEDLMFSSMKEFGGPDN